MAKQSTKIRILYLLLLISAVFVCLPAKFTDKANFAISGIINLVSSKPYSLAAETSSQIEEVIEPNDEYNSLLQRYNSILNELNNTQSEVEYQRRHIEELSNIRSEFSFGRATLVRAHITAEDTSISRNCKIINRGSRDGVRPGLYALASNEVTAEADFADRPNYAVWKSAVAGKVIDVGLTSSTVQMINDPAFTESVIVKAAHGRNVDFESEGIIYYEGKGVIKVKHVETTCPVKPGDPIFLKASEKTMPIDVIIGYVESCNYNPDNAVLWNITVQPAIDLNDIKDVILVFHSIEE